MHQTSEWDEGNNWLEQRGGNGGRFFVETQKHDFVCPV
jgi:hypothetical protein